MNHFLDWYAEHNKTVIQLLFVIIGLGLIYLIYRLFFITSAESDHSPEVKKSTPQKNVDPVSPIVKLNTANEVSESSKVIQTENVVNETIALEQVSNQAIEQKTQQDLDQALIQIEELKKIKLQLDEDLEKQKQTEKIIQKELEQAKIEIKETVKEAAKGAKETSGYSYVDTSQLVGDEALVKKIDELQLKLQEYDIISDDIAELQDLRKENEQLKAELNNKS